MSTFLDTKREGTNVEQERIDDNYLADVAVVLIYDIYLAILSFLPNTK